MSAIWLLNTRGRPEQCQQALDACEQTGMTSRGLLYVDETVEMYQDIRLPDNWEVHFAPKWGTVAAAMKYTLERYPDASQYGWLADDNIPRTDGWDTKLEQAAGDWSISMARDLWMSETGWKYLSGGPCFTSGLCWGAKLIKAVGWWALPGAYQGGIDAAWNDLAGMCHLTRYLPDVVIEHLCWQLEKRPKDETDERVKHGTNYINNDLGIYEEWRKRQRFVDARVIKHAIRRAR
jgi:hypothetical protein